MIAVVFLTMVGSHNENLKCLVDYQILFAGVDPVFANWLWKVEIFPDLVPMTSY